MNDNHPNDKLHNNDNENEEEMFDEHSKLDNAELSRGEKFAAIIAVGILVVAFLFVGSCIHKCNKDAEESERAEMEYHRIELENQRKMAEINSLIDETQRLLDNNTTTPSQNETNTYLSPSNRNVHTIKSGNWYGCTSKELFNTISGLDFSDKAAFQKALKIGVMTGEVTIFKHGEQVYLEKAGISTIVVRRKGEITKYWTFAEAI